MVRNGCIADHLKLSLQWITNMYFNQNETVFERDGLLKSALNRINTLRVKHLIEVDLTSASVMIFFIKPSI